MTAESMRLVDLLLTGVKIFGNIILAFLLYLLYKIKAII